MRHLRLRLAPALAALATSVLAALPLAGQGHGITYAPGAQRYRVVTIVTRSDRAQGQEHNYEITSTQQVSLALTPRARDTLQFEITLDSAKLESTLPVQLPDVTKLRGTKVTGVMSPSGKIYNSTSAAGAGEADVKNAVDGMTRFLIAVPAGATVGSSWIDTVASTDTREGSNLTTRTIITSKVLGDTVFGGENAWRVGRSLALSLSGTATQQGQQLNMQGQGTGQGTYYVSSRGVYLGSTASQKMNMTVAIPSNGLTIPVVQNVTSRVERLK